MKMNKFKKKLNKAKRIRAFYILAKKYGFVKRNPEVYGYFSEKTLRAFEQAHTGEGCKSFDTVEELMKELETPA